MCYTEEQIEKYLEILNNYNNTSTNQAVEDEVRCWNCQSNRFFVNSRYKICEDCGASNGHVLGWGLMIRKIMIDYIFERRVFIRESITMRKG